MALLKKTKKEETTEKELDIVNVDEQNNNGKMNLNMEHLKEQIDKLSTKGHGKNKKSSESVNIIDRKKIEDRIVETINNLDEDGKKDLGNSLIKIIREILDEELKDRIVVQDNPVVKQPKDSDFVSRRDGALDMYGDEDELDRIGAKITVDDLIQRLESGDLDKLAIASIHAVNKIAVKKQYGDNAYENINSTLIEKLSRVFPDSQINCVGDDEYVVYDFSSEPRKFIDDINAFRKTIYSINTSNQYNYPIEINVGDAHGLLCGDAKSTYERAHALSFNVDESENARNNAQEKKPEAPEKIKETKSQFEEHSEEKTEVKTTYKTIEFIDDDLDEDLYPDNDSYYAEPAAKSSKLNSNEKNYKKAMADFPYVLINANIVDADTRASVDVNLVINMIERSEKKQEILVSGNVGTKEILLISDYNDEKTTMEIAAEYGLILRFGSAIKLFILKENKEKYQLIQDVKKNTDNKEPLKVDELFVCPLSINENKIAFVYVDNAGHTLIKADEHGIINFKGKKYKCNKNEGVFKVVV